VFDKRDFGGTVVLDVLEQGFFVGGLELPLVAEGDSQPYCFRPRFMPARTTALKG
jgi:hypothetical protein